MRVTSETKNATRSRILEVAQKQFAKQGFEATTTRDIARAAQIATGTLFNYFPTKEAIVEHLVGEAFASAADGAVVESSPAPPDEPLTLEEDLFAHAAAILRRLKAYRKYLPAVLETSLSPLTGEARGEQPSLRIAHLEIVGQTVSRHGLDEALSSVALQLYWTLFTGVLAFWSKDASPRQEDTLALLDQSLAMFVLWLRGPASATAMDNSKG
jgi:AcrR family transcriptional regulator